MTHPDKTANYGMLNMPTPEDFTHSLGQATWLMTLSKNHRELPLQAMQSRIIAPLMLRQLRVYIRDTQPIGVVTWAYGTPQLKERLLSGWLELDLPDWRSGPEAMIVDIVSPLFDPEIIRKSFEDEISALTAQPV